MAKCVAIEVSDDGAVSVGAIPPGQYGDAMQPAASLEEALMQAKSLLGGAQGAVANENAFAQGFAGEGMARGMQGA